MRVYPEYIDLLHWAATVIDDYRTYPLPILEDTNKWVEWANVLVTQPPFRKEHLVTPQDLGITKEAFEEDNSLWRVWAKHVYAQLQQ